MSSDKLRKYLSYYRKTLNEEPENIEARLRLAALFREMGRQTHAIEEYGTAAKLLASEGLPLEAIAACKAILELDPSHQETQLFLAKLYAEVPEATDESVRVARPLESGADGRSEGPPGMLEGGLPEDFEAAGAAITLEEPKDGAGEEQSVVEPSEADEDRPTTQVERPEVPAEHTVPEPGETTRVQSRQQQEKLRHQAVEEEDRQSIELDVFEMESLGLDESSENWDELEAFDEVDEPDTREVQPLDGEDDEASTARREFRISRLPNIPLFSQLPREVFVEVLDAMELEELSAETEILDPDDPASCLYIVVRGRVRVQKEKMGGEARNLATMGEGEVFGEFRLLTGRGGRASVVAETDVQLLAVSDEVVYRLGEKYPELWDVLWSFYHERMLNHALATNPLFETLDRDERQLVVEHFDQGELGAEQALFERGDSVGELSLIVRGSVRVEVPEEDGDREEDDWKIVDTLREGAFVGVSPCALEEPATATVRARTDVVLYRMEGKVFRELMYGLPAVGEAVRELIDVRQARTPPLPGVSSNSERV